MNRFYTTGEVADLLGLERWKLMYLLERRLVPSPSLRVPGRRLFSTEDVAAIREHLAGNDDQRANVDADAS